VFTNIFLVDPQYIWWRCGDGLHVIVELEAIYVPEVTRLTDAQNY
jgi:hypothetical protein